VGGRIAWGWACCRAEYGVELPAAFRAVAVGAGLETSGTCSRLSSVSSSFDGEIVSGSSIGVGSAGIVSVTGSTGAGSGTGSSGSFVGGSVGSSIFAGSAGLSSN
jgi:hypothetical protein